MNCWTVVPQSRDPVGAHHNARKRSVYVNAVVMFCLVVALCCLSMVGYDVLARRVLSSTLGVQPNDDVIVAIGGNDDVGGANKTDFYFLGILTSATLAMDDNRIVKNDKLVS